MVTAWMSIRMAPAPVMVDRRVMAGSVLTSPIGSTSRTGGVACSQLMAERQLSQKAVPHLTFIRTVQGTCRSRET